MVRVMQRVRDIAPPSCTNLQLIQEYYSGVRECLEHSEGAVYNFAMQLHEVYLTPLNGLFEMLSPYEDFIRRKEEITKLIDQQIFHNETLYEKLGPIGI